MDPNWASENIQVIRTLMERATVYRRALAPIMFGTGALGIAAAALGLLTTRFNSNRGFALLWVITAALALGVAFVLARRQALKEQEAFWSPPTRRVAQALIPAFLAGALAGLLLLIAGDQLPSLAWLLAFAWLILYGCALHAAGFFVERGIKLFGLCCTTLSALGVIVVSLLPLAQTPVVAHALMGAVYGLGHLAYGVYLHFTERRHHS